LEEKDRDLTTSFENRCSLLLVVLEADIRGRVLERAWYPNTENGFLSPKGKRSFSYARSAILYDS
jgi:hypothetical protein